MSGLLTPRRQRLQEGGTTLLENGYGSTLPVLTCAVPLAAAQITKASIWCECNEDLVSGCPSVRVLPHRTGMTNALHILVRARSASGA
jgi:hypothetical protein